MHRIVALCTSALTAVGLALLITFAITPLTADTPPETAASAPVTAPPSPAAASPVSGGVTPSDAGDGRVPQQLVIDDVRRYAWHSGELVPPDFDHVFEVLDPAAGYSGGPETLRLMLAHATSEGNPRGPSPGNAWLMLQPGDTVTTSSGTYTVTEVWDADKDYYESQPPLADDTWAEYNGALVLVTCVPRTPADDGSWRAAIDNRWTVLRPIGET